MPNDDLLRYCQVYILCFSCQNTVIAVLDTDVLQTFYARYSPMLNYLREGIQQRSINTIVSPVLQLYPRRVIFDFFPLNHQEKEGSVLCPFFIDKAHSSSLKFPYKNWIFYFFFIFFLIWENAPFPKSPLLRRQKSECGS